MSEKTKKRAGSPRKDKPTLASPKTNRKNFTEKHPTIQELISAFAELKRKIKKDETLENTLLRFCMYLESKRFDIVDSPDLVTVPYRYPVFSNKLG